MRFARSPAPSVAYHLGQAFSPLQTTKDTSPTLGLRTRYLWTRWPLTNPLPHHCGGEPG
jgi:hypothetical protein